MISTLRSLFRPRFRPLFRHHATDAAPVVSWAAVPPGQRLYAIGDIHGRLDLFRTMIDRIDADDAARDPAETTVILLGDLVDRGPDSAGVIDAARTWGRQRRVRLVQGNHEEMFLRSFDDDETLRHFLRYGGRETLASYAIPPDACDHATMAELRRMMATRVPAADIAFLHAMEERVHIGDYLFVHAGIRPGVPIAEQTGSDMRWIRGEFLQDRSVREFMVVHGHTIVDEPEFTPNRIGLDTGAFQSGRLTAIGLEGTRQCLVTVSDNDPSGIS